jgi:hypothetical protein
MGEQEARLRDRFRGCLLGLALGDALGTTLEFRLRGSFEPITDMMGGGPFRLRPGQWTDDTSMALFLAESLVACRGFDPRDQMERYCRWAESSYTSSTGTCFDIGGTVSAAFRRYRVTREPFSGSTDPFSAGNGCIMRLAPIPMFFFPRHGGGRTLRCRELPADAWGPGMPGCLPPLGPHPRTSPPGWPEGGGSPRGPGRVLAMREQISELADKLMAKHSSHGARWVEDSTPRKLRPGPAPQCYRSPSGCGSIARKRTFPQREHLPRVYFSQLTAPHLTSPTSAAGRVCPQETHLRRQFTARPPAWATIMDRSTDRVLNATPDPVAHAQLIARQPPLQRTPPGVGGDRPAEQCSDLGPCRVSSRR